ncbi:MAG: N-acetylmuramoyl-L-alanine amidase [Bacteroidota bacterium]|nr:N-acetylmuramoyl-L-alanine amidase [Bacteroidota bacterium]
MLWIFCAYNTKSVPKKAGIKTIVIDAGHGGKDPGCQYGGYNEKTITLNIALKLGKIIKENYKDVRVIYTRTDDNFVELIERAGIANRAKADLFISIHVNANPNKKIAGTETYTLGTHKTDDNLAVAKRENEVILLESDFKEKYEGYDPYSPEADIIFSLYQDAFLKQSLKFAQFVESNLHKMTQHKSRGIKQAGFVVLWKTTMPSILIETGFLSNEAERKYLHSKKGQDDLSKGIYTAFVNYKNTIESR